MSVVHRQSACDSGFFPSSLICRSSGISYSSRLLDFAVECFRTVIHCLACQGPKHLLVK